MEKNKIAVLSPYEQDGGKHYHETVNGGLGQRGYNLVSKWRATKMQSYIKPTDAVLEYGVGTGWNLAHLQAASRKGFDVAAAMRPFVEAQGITFVTAFNETDIAAYDVVICSHVLEHLLQPADALMEIKKYLKPTGHLLLYVPYDVERRFRTYNPNDPNHHLYGWNVQTLSNLCILQGFALEKGQLRRFGYERFVAKWVERWNLPDFTYSYLVRLALLLKPAHEVEIILKNIR